MVLYEPSSQRMRTVSYAAYPRRMTLTWLPCCAELGTIEIRALTFTIADAVQVARENLRLCPPKKVDGILTEPVARPLLSVRTVEMTTPPKVMFKVRPNGNLPGFTESGLLRSNSGKWLLPLMWQR